MGEISDQLMRGRLGVLDWQDAVKKAPYLDDLRLLGYDRLLNMLHSIYALKDRPIPRPHKRYGHIVWDRGAIHGLYSLDELGLCRRIASIVEAENSLFEAVPYRGLSAVFLLFGLNDVADRVNTNGARKLAAIKDEMEGCLVWDMPEKPNQERVYSYVAILKPDNEITGGNLSVLGERCSRIWLGCQHPGKFVGDSVSSPFDFGEGHHVHPCFRDEFIKEMDTEYGDHRSPIIF